MLGNDFSFQAIWAIDSHKCLKVLQAALWLLITVKQKRLTSVICWSKYAHKNIFFPQFLFFLIICGQHAISLENTNVEYIDKHTAHYDNIQYNEYKRVDVVLFFTTDNDVLPYSTFKYHSFLIWDTATVFYFYGATLGKEICFPGNHFFSKAEFSWKRLYEHHCHKLSLWLTNFDLMVALMSKKKQTMKNEFILKVAFMSAPHFEGPSISFVNSQQWLI